MKKFASIFLSLLILISSMGITYSTHYCMGRAVDSELVIGMHELTCGMEDMDGSCESSGTDLMEPGCCDNDFISINTDDDYQVVITEFSLDANFLFAFTYSFIFDYKGNLEPCITYADHHPPPLEQDYQSLYQSFLL